MTPARRIAGIASVFALFLICGVSPAHAWWNSDWSYRMKIHVDTTSKGAAVTDKLGRVQVLLRLHAGNFNFDAANPDGKDLRLVGGDDHTPLHFEIERYDGLADQVALIWVDLPNLQPSADNAIYLYWGNKTAPDASDGQRTFDADQLLIYHFATDTGPPRDSTGFGNDALTSIARGVSGLIGSDAKFDGTHVIALPKSASLKFESGATTTWSMWIKPDATAAGGKDARLVSQVDGPAGLSIGLAGMAPYAEITGPEGPKRVTSPAALDPSAWHLIAVTTGDTLRLYVDGEPKGEAAVAMPALAAGATLGGGTATPPSAPVYQPSTGGPTAGGSPAPASTPPAVTAAPTDGSELFAGEIDEFTIAKAARPAAEIKLWMTEKNPETLFAFDTAEQASFFGNGYVGVIVRSVTPDAWAVIGILGAMALISWWVMIGKAFFLSSVSRANAAFEARYRIVSAPGAAAGAVAAEISARREPRLRRSPLYRLYSVGMRELEARLSAGMIEPDGRLASQSIAAMRASIDAILVRESQRLNRSMVLLTICISGGPFLGLLGTVVGVMITFAAIAQAGDVNVNAIAPGVAAALLATVAGLFVAIPALFGYNYLLGRIRELNAQMVAFADELVTGIAETVRKPMAKAAE